MTTSTAPNRPPAKTPGSPPGGSAGDVRTGQGSALLTLTGVSRRFGLRRVLETVDLVVTEGSYVAVVGENGSGKSTLLRLMAGLLRPTEGTVTRAPAARRVLLLSSGGSLVPKLDAWQTAEFLGGVERPRASERVADVFGRFGVDRFAERPVAALSLGMKQRLAFATAALVDPDVLLLDEPFHGLDTAGAGEARALLGELSRGRAVVHAAHELLDVLGMADGVLDIADGVARWQTSAEASLTLATELVVSPVGRAIGVLSGMGVESAVVGPSRLRARPGRPARDLVVALIAGGCSVDAVIPVMAR